MPAFSSVCTKSAQLFCARACPQFPKDSLFQKGRTHCTKYAFQEHLYENVFVVHCYPLRKPLKTMFHLVHVTSTLPIPIRPSHWTTVPYCSGTGMPSKGFTSTKSSSTCISASLSAICLVHAVSNKVQK